METPATPETPVATPNLGEIASVAQWREAKQTPPTQAPEPKAAAPEPVAPEVEAESTKPDTEVSEAARTLRRNRAEERKAKIQREIDELTRTKYQLLDDVQRMRQSSPSQASQPAATPAPQGASSDKPKLEAFESYEAYVEALAEWKADQKVNAALAAERKASQQQNTVTAYQGRVTKFLEQHPDYNEVISNPAVVATELMLRAISESEHGPAVAYHLGKNPDLSRRWASLDPVSLFKELGRLEATLSAPAVVPQPKPVTQAPAPITPVQQAATAPINKELNDITSVAEWRKRRAEATGRG